jgi:pyridoxal 5'-phosphate synthase pdxT subunit
MSDMKEQSHLRVGVLAYQGDVREHVTAVQQCGAQSFPVRYPEEICTCDALIMPGGESTTIGKLIVRNNLEAPIRELVEAGKPLFGTCAGLILMATDIIGSDQFRFGMLHATVERNAYGRQVESFEAEVPAPTLGDEPLRGVFIRAPQIVSIGDGVTPLASFEGRIVLCRQDNLLAASFHPELTSDTRVHRYLLSMCKTQTEG